MNRKSFLTRTLRTREKAKKKPCTPACSTQTVSAAPTATMLPTPLPPSSRAVSVPAAPAATTLPKSLPPSLSPTYLPAAVDEIMDEASAVIPPVSSRSGGFSHLQQHNPAARPFLHAEGFTATHIPVSYPPVPKTRAGRIDDTIYFNQATQRPQRWNVSAKLFFCVCDLNTSVPCKGVQIKQCPTLNTLNRSCASTLPQQRVVAGWDRLDPVPDASVLTMPHKRSSPVVAVVSALCTMAQPSSNGLRPLRASESLAAQAMKVITATKHFSQMLVTNNGRWIRREE